MPKLRPGVYDLPLTVELERALGELDSARMAARREAPDPADSHELLGRHVAHLVRQILETVPKDERIARQATICNEVIAALARHAGDDGLEGGGSHRNACVCGELTAAVLDGQLCRGGDVTGERVHAPHLHRRDEVARFEITNECGPVGSEFRRIEAVDVLHGRSPACEQFAECLDSDGAGSDGADAGDGNTHSGGVYRLLQRLAHTYLGPDVVFPKMPNPPPGYVTRIRVERVRGVGPWRRRG